MSAHLTLGEIVHLPAPWVLVAAILAGAALSVATRRVRPRGAAEVAERPTEAARERAAARKWILFSMLLSGAVALGLVAVFLPGPEKIRSAKYLAYFGGGVLVFGAALRLPKTVGIVLVLACLVLCATLYLFTLAWTPFVGTTEIGRVVVFGARDGLLDLDVRAPGRPDALVRLEGGVVVPLVRTARFDDLWPVLGWRRWYRLEGLEGDAGGAFHYPRSEGVPENLYALFERRWSLLPGVRLVRSEELHAAPERPPALEELAVYAMVLSEDGSVEITDLPR